MTRLITNRLNASSIYDQPIDDDRSCASCGYNLRGLRTSGRCPECGEPIAQHRGTAASGARKSRAIDFCDLAPGTIRKFSIGFYLAAVTLLGILALVFINFRLGWSAELYAGTVTILSFIWFAAVWLMTSPLDIPAEQRLGEPWELTARMWARWLQLGWFVHAAISWYFAVAAPLPGPMTTALKVTYVVFGFGGAMGVALLCLLLANFSAWVRDDFAERCFNCTFGGLVFVSPLVFIALPIAMTAVFILIIAFIMLWVVWVFCIFAFPLGLWSLGRSLSWAARHSRDRIDRTAEFANSLAPEPPPEVATAVHADTPIPLGQVAEPHEITFDMAQSHAEETTSARPMRRDRYDHERGDARGRPGETPQADLF